MTAASPAWSVVAALLAGSAAAGDLAALKARGVLRVVVAADEAPETFALAGAEHPGFEREILDGFARQHALRIEVVRAPTYADRIPLLRDGKGDLVVAIFDTPERRQLVDFTREVMPTRNVAVTLSSGREVASLETLRAVRLAAIRGAQPAQAAVAAGVNADSLVLFDRMEDLLQALVSGRVEAAVLPISEFALVSKRVRGLRAGVTVGAVGVVAWAVRKQDRALLEALDEYLSRVRRGPTWNRLIVKYFGDQALDVLGRRRE